MNIQIDYNFTGNKQPQEFRRNLIIIAPFATAKYGILCFYMKITMPVKCQIRNHMTMDSKRRFVNCFHKKTILNLRSIIFDCLKLIFKFLQDLGIGEI